MIYLDYNATTPLSPVALDAMLPFLERAYGNASSIHRAGREARAALDDSRDRMAALLKAKPHEIIFTGGGTEADNLAVLGLARAHAEKGKHLITVATEHHAVLHAFQYLERHEGFEVSTLPVDSLGRVDPDTLRRTIRTDTTLISIMSANNETGTLQPIRELTEIARSEGILFHSDMVQSFGKEDIIPDDLGVDAVSLAAHKFHGPKGAGILYLRAGVPIMSLQQGGSHENQRRPGTENVAAIVGMAAAAEEAVKDMEKENLRQISLREQLWSEIEAVFPGAVRHGSREHSLPNTLDVSFPGGDGEMLLIGFDLEGVCVSSGSACMVGSVQASHVLLAMGVAPELARATVRFSLGRETTPEEIVQTGEAFRRVWTKQGREFDTP